jgi:hypothetical protein
MTHFTQPRLMWQKMSDDCYEAHGHDLRKTEDSRYAVLFLGFDADNPWLATSSGPHRPRPEPSLITAQRQCQRWADAYDIYLNTD